WFAIDLAERALQAERASKREADERLWQALAVRRALLSGDADESHWLDAKALASKAHKDSVARAVAVVVPAYNRMMEVSIASKTSPIDESLRHEVQAQYAQSVVTVAIHLAAGTVISMDLPQPSTTWKVVIDAANALTTTKEANRPESSRVIADSIEA